MPPKGPKKKVNRQNLSNETTQQNSASNSVKSQQKSARRHQKFSENIYVKIDGETNAEFMKSFIKPGSTGYGICEVCTESIKIKTGRDNPYKVATENIYSHIQTESHKSQTKTKDLDKLEKLIDAINLKKKVKAEAKSNFEDNARDYLEFLALLLRERLSFSQISHIGNYLRKMQELGKLDFLKAKNFDEEEISRATNSMGEALLEKLKKELESAKYSFCIDSSTVAGENICALKIRYQTQEEDDYKLPIQKTQSRIISIKTLQESSTGQTYLNIVENKLLNLNEEIQANFVGITHDNASCLSSHKNGLYGLIKKKKTDYFFDLPDPCHGLNLVLQDSIKGLPNDLMKFVDKIHHYFQFPQRKAKLALIQRKLGQEKLLLCRYVETRWLSLGLSLERLLQVWPGLIEYMKTVY